jgi:hypothetical protein
MSEHVEQSILFQRARMYEPRVPELRLLHAIPNGGDRHPAVAAKLRAEGVRAGVPDVCLPVPRRGHSALYIEMKRLRPRATKTGISFDRTRTTLEQELWIEGLRSVGCRVEVCYTAEEAWAVIADYLEVAA